MTRIKFLLIALVLYVVSMNLPLHENHSNAYLSFTIYGISGSAGPCGGRRAGGETGREAFGKPAL